MPRHGGSTHTHPPCLLKQVASSSCTRDAIRVVYHRPVLHFVHICFIIILSLSGFCFGRKCYFWCFFFVLWKGLRLLGSTRRATVNRPVPLIGFACSSCWYTYEVKSQSLSGLVLYPPSPPPRSFIACRISHSHRRYSRDFCLFFCRPVIIASKEDTRSRAEPYV